MKTEEELAHIAAVIGAIFAKQMCCHADISVILEMLRQDSYFQMFKSQDKKEDVHKVKIE